MLIDCFPFFNELELLKIRIYENFSLVDKFIIIEADKTHQGNPKKLIFDKNLDQFRNFMKKIEYITMTFPPDMVGTDSNANWDRERYQREYALQNIKFSDDDLVIVSDVDEIIRKSSLKYYLDTYYGDVAKFSLKRYSYYLNYQEVNNSELQLDAKISSYSHMMKKDKNLPMGVIRYCDMYGEIKEPNLKIIEDAGWHFTFMGGIDRIKQKVESFAHGEYNNEDNTAEKIRVKVEQGKDIYLGNQKYEKVYIDQSWPKYVLENIEFFKINNWIK